MVFLEAEEERGLAEEKQRGSWRKPASQTPVPLHGAKGGGLGGHTNAHPQKPHSTGRKTSRTRYIPSGAAPKRSAQRNNRIYHIKYKYPSLTRNKLLGFQTETYCTDFLCALAGYRYIYFIAIQRK